MSVEYDRLFPTFSSKTSGPSSRHVSSSAPALIDRTPS